MRNTILGIFSKNWIYEFIQFFLSPIKLKKRDFSLHRNFREFIKTRLKVHDRELRRFLETFQDFQISKTL